MNQEWRRGSKAIVSVLLVLLLLSISVSAVSAAGETRIVTDMMGREVEIPTEINSVLCGSQPSYTFMYTIAPDKLAGSMGNKSNEYVIQKYAALPPAGDIGQGANFETYLKIDPDIVLMSNYPVYSDEAAARDAVASLQDKLQPIPVVYIKDGTNLTGYSDPMRFLGDLLDEEEQAQEMISFYENVLATVQEKVASIPDNEKVRVYYAGRTNGLATTPAGSTFSQLIEVGGGKNVADIPKREVANQVVSIEQVMTWDPDVVLVLDPEFYKKIKTDPAWKNIAAIKNNRVYLVPETTFSWITAPPGLNRIIGIPWIAKTLYPDLFQDMDLEELVREYHRIFLHISLTDEQIREILNA